MNDTELLYAATARCRCGAGLAYPLDHEVSMKIGAWVCSRVLRGEADGPVADRTMDYFNKSVQPVGEHDKYPWACWKIREETSINNRGGATTRPAGTVARTVGKATCPKCGHKWQSEPYSACGADHHWLSGPCPGCGYAVASGITWRSDEGAPIEHSFVDVILQEDAVDEARVVPTGTPTPVTVANPTGGQAAARAKDGGRVSVQVLGSLFFAAFLAVLSLLCLCSPAKAEEQPRWTYGPSAAAAVAAIDLRTGDYLAGAQAVALGPCLGATFTPWQLGADICANVQVGKAEPNRYGASIMGHWRTWFDGGFGVLFVQGEPLRLLALIGARAPFLQF